MEPNQNPNAALVDTNVNPVVIQTLGRIAGGAIFDHQRDDVLKVISAGFTTVVGDDGQPVVVARSGRSVLEEAQIRLADPNLAGALKPKTLGERMIRTANALKAQQAANGTRPEFGKPHGGLGPNRY